MSIIKRFFTWVELILIKRKQHSVGDIIKAGNVTYEVVEDVNTGTGGEFISIEGEGE